MERVNEIMNVGLIVHRFPPAIGGSERYTEVLANKLHRRNHEVTIYTTKSPARDCSDFPFNIKEFSNWVPENFGYFGWPGVLSPSALQSLTDQDVLHAVGADMFSAVVGAFACKLRDVPSVLTTFYHPPRVQTHRRLKYLYDQYVLQNVLKAYDHLVMSSDFEEKQMREVFKLGESQATQMRIPPTVSEPATEIFREKYNLNGKFLLLYVGRLDSHKGMSTLLPAVEQLLQTDTSLHCVVVGETERWHEWPAKVERVVERNQDSFTFTGIRTGGDLAAVYEASDVFVFPSRYETYGLVTVEALSHGTPVIATPVGVAPELIQNGENGYIHEIGDTRGLISCINKVRESELSVIKSNARESVASLSWDDTVTELEQLYSTHTRES